ncbi:MAG: EamA family transporter [Patescibacteria group bacterium]
MVYIFLALIFYTIAIMFGSTASRHANTNLVAAIVNLISAIIPIAIIIPILSKKLLENPNVKFGILMAIITGIAIAFFTMTLNKSYSENKVAIVAPIVFGGAIFLSAILSSLFFKEKISNMQGMGLFFMAIALILITYARATGK